MQTGITQKHTAVGTPADDSPITKLRPVAVTDDTGHAGAHVQFAIGIAAEQRVELEPMHRSATFPR